jgi:hypothetical protein
MYSIEFLPSRISLQRQDRKPEEYPRNQGRILQEERAGEDKQNFDRSEDDSTGNVEVDIDANSCRQ